MEPMAMPGNGTTHQFQNRDPYHPNFIFEESEHGVYVAVPDQFIIFLYARDINDFILPQIYLALKDSKTMLMSQSRNRRLLMNPPDHTALIAAPKGSPLRETAMLHVYRTPSCGFMLDLDPMSAKNDKKEMKVVFHNVADIERAYSILANYAYSPFDNEYSSFCLPPSLLDRFIKMIHEPHKKDPNNDKLIADHEIFQMHVGCYVDMLNSILLTQTLPKFPTVGMGECEIILAMMSKNQKTGKPYRPNRIEREIKELFERMARRYVPPTFSFMMFRSVVSMMEILNMKIRLYIAHTTTELLDPRSEQGVLCDLDCQNCKQNTCNQNKKNH